MSANPESAQELIARPIWSEGKGVALRTHKQIRRATGDVIRAMGRRQCTMAEGTRMIRALRELHGMLTDEQRVKLPQQPGITHNTLVVAGPDSPVARAARQLLGAGATAVDARCLPHEPVPAADGGSE